MVTQNPENEISPIIDTEVAPEPIAIIGLGCRFPGAKNPAAFWELLRNGVDAVTEIPADRWDINEYYDEDPKVVGKMNTRWSGLLDQVDKFDPYFFKISPREAPYVDPQQRLLMEVAWEALEDAGQVPEKLAGTNTGVFIGIMTNDYSLQTTTDADLVNFYSVPGVSYCIAANRLSYFFDFHGPSMAIDTACSSSLVAVHQACRSIWSGESTLALAGGVNVILSAEGTVWYTKGGLMAPDGRCKAFDARANGLVRGEGAGIVVLKPLSQAVADGDPIYALIHGSAVNQDGRSNGMTAPNRFAQEAVMRTAYRRAGISPGQVRYVEAHGTGTALGDPIEAMALGTVLATDRPADDYCAIGSVKTNIGHLEAAAGVAALIKVSLMLKHRTIPASLHFETPSPLIPFETLPIRVQQETAPWPEQTGAAYSGINGCGFGGTNAHLVLGEAPATAVSTEGSEETISENKPQLLSISARTREALKASAQAYRDYLATEGQADSLRDICYTAGVRRSQHDYRLSLVGETHEALRENLETYLRGESVPAISTGRVLPSATPKAVFVFSGQGSQWLGMALQLFRQEPVFRASLERCEQELSKYQDWSVIEQLKAGAEDSRLQEGEIVQPCLFAVQVSLAALWNSWGIVPAAVVGHSMGEVAAAHVAGALNLEDAARVICRRSQVLKPLSGQGAMAFVELTPEETQTALAGYEDRLSVAGSNSPTSTVISGETAALEEVLQAFQEQNIFSRRIKTDIASHSPRMEGARARLVEELDGLTARRPSVPTYSTVIGGYSEDLSFDAAYWGRNLREPVMFAAAIQNLIADGFDTFVEVSPHPILLISIQQGLAQAGREGKLLPSLRRETDERASLLSSLGSLHIAGHAVNWSALTPDAGRIVSLPSYAWQRERFWVEPSKNRTRRTRSNAQGGARNFPLLGAHQQSANPAISHLWEIELSPRSPKFLDDHRVQGAVVFPGAGYVEMVQEAVAEIYGVSSTAQLTEIEFRRALFLPEQDARIVQMTFTETTLGTVSFQIYSRAESADAAQLSWTLHVVGNIRLEPDAGNDGAILAPATLDIIRERCGEELDGADFYELLNRAGNHYGASFRGIDKLWQGDGEALALLQVPSVLEKELQDYVCHPAIIDNCLQSLGAAVAASQNQGEDRGPCVPLGIERVRVSGRTQSRLWSHARLRTGEGEGLIGDVVLSDEDGRVVCELSGIQLQYLEESAQPTAPENLREWLYELQWRQRDLVPEDSSRDLSAPGAAEGRWLIFDDGRGVAAALTQSLERCREDWVMVTSGEEFEQVDDRNFRLRASQAEDLQRLFEIAFKSGQLDCRGVVSLQALDNSTANAFEVEPSDVPQPDGCLNALALVQELARIEWRVQPRVWLVTKGAQPVTGADEIAIAQAPLWGFGRTAAQEQPALWGGLIDVAPEASAAETAELVSAEIRSHGGENQIAFRQGRRFVCRLARRQDARRSAPTMRWRTDGSYLITGGIGGLGLSIARSMVEQGARRLVLMSRSELPPRSEWSRVDGESALGQQLIAIRQLEALGASIRVVAIDVTNEGQLRSFLETFRAEGWPQIRGVVHAAGVLQDKTLLQLDADAFHSAWKPKVHGAWLLHQLLREESLDFFILFSSAASLLGSAGQANYASANAFLDALAHERRSRNLPALSINWGAWSEVGMAAQKTRGGRLAARGFGNISPQQGVEVFEQLLGEDSTQVGVLPINWTLARASTPALAESPLYSEVAFVADD
ncbi:MAG TPA: type I polyketide synthase, partial [Pyrinomonadaceae bacterium]